MTSLLFGISLSALLSVTSLLVVLFRVSPLTSPNQAIPAFLLSLFLSVGSVATLLFYALWRYFPIHSWDAGKLLSISLRQGALIGFATLMLVLFALLGMLTWWAALLIVAACAMVEVALNS